MPDPSPAPSPAPGSDPQEIRIGISACLMGDEVRFDGGHKRDSFLMDQVAPFVRYISVCPEIGIGLGTPRETLRLERGTDGPRLIARKTGRDLTDTMRAYSREKSQHLAGLGLSGFILKSKSPTCGMERVKEYDDNGVPTGSTRGLFADELMRALPHLPVEEEGRLRDPRLREHFFVRVFAHDRVERFLASDWTLGDLVAFHSREKLLLLAHEPEGYRDLGRLVAHSKGRDRDELANEYRDRYFRAIAGPAGIPRHLNVLQHAVGYFRGVLGDEERRDIRQVLDDYSQSLVPLIVPVTLIRQIVRARGIDYLAQQRYLDPHPKELALRNFV